MEGKEEREERRGREALNESRRAEEKRSIDRVIDIDRIGVGKITFRRKRRKQMRAGINLFGPRKSRCIDLKQA